MKKIVLIICTTLIFTSCMKTKDCFTITVESNDITMGTVTGGGVYVDGSTAVLTAIPKSGYSFDHWEESWSKENPREIKVWKDATYTAVFKCNASVMVKDDFYGRTYEYECYDCDLDLNSNKLTFSTSMFSSRLYPMIELQYKWSGEICNGTFVGYSNIDFSSSNITLGNPYLWYYDSDYADNPVYIGNQAVGDIWCEDVALKIVSIDLDTKLASFIVDANCLDYHYEYYVGHRPHHLTITVTDVPLVFQ